MHESELHSHFRAAGNAVRRAEACPERGCGPVSLEKRPPGVMLYFAEMRPLLALMNDAERGQILEAILDYAEYDAEPFLKDRLEAAWPFVKRMIDRDAETYRKKCEKASKSAKSRWKKEGEKG